MGGEECRKLCPRIRVPHPPSPPQVSSIPLIPTHLFTNVCFLSPPHPPMFDFYLLSHLPMFDFYLLSHPPMFDFYLLSHPPRFDFYLSLTHPCLIFTSSLTHPCLISTSSHQAMFDFYLPSPTHV